MQPILKAGNIRKQFGAVEALRGVDLTVMPGEIVAVVGPSGSGKSTLLHCLGGLDRPDAGTVRTGGLALWDLSDSELSRLRNRRVGFVFQFHHLLPEFTVFENILLPHWIKSGRPGTALKAEADRLIERVGLTEIKDKYVTQISGGQQQRVSIARALINRPKVIFADEPTGNLDRETGTRVLDLLREINKENRTTLVMVTHDREVALRSDHIIELVDGRICRTIDIRASGRDSAVEMLEDLSCVLPGLDRNAGN